MSKSSNRSPSSMRMARLRNKKFLQPHDDEQPVTSRELKGWYLHNFACGAYDVAIAGFFIPVVLERLTSQVGYELDRVTPCNIDLPDHKCVVKLGAIYLDTQSFSLYVIALSVLLQCILFISCSSLADHGANRKNFLLFFSSLGAISTLSFALVIKSEWYLFASIMTIISNCCFGAAYVFHLAYIPILSRIHPEVLSLKDSDAPRQELLKAEEKVATKLSANTTSIGFIAGLLVIFGGLGIVEGLHQSPYSLRVAIAFGGGWWLFWLIFPLLWLKKHPRPPLPSTENRFTYSFKRVYKTLRSARKLRETMKFLISWFLLSDGINTIGPMAALFGTSKFKLTETQLIIVAIIVPVTAAIGVYLFYVMEKFFNLTPKTMILINTVLLALLPIYSLLGFVSPFGMVHYWEIWLFASYFGLSLGSVQAYCQTFFSSLIPMGHENEFFSLYLITAKGSSWLGPLLVGIVTNSTHEIRNGFWVLAIMLVIPCIIITTVNVDKGIKDAKEFAEKEQNELCFNYGI